MANLDDLSPHASELALLGPRCFMMLTIAIPTFNRMEELKMVVSCLLPQLNEKCCLSIHDDGQQSGIESYINGVAMEFPAARVTIVRNQFNLGAEGNILRAIECCSTEWIWLLGDDDIPTVDAIERLLQDITSASSEIVFLNYLTLEQKRNGLRKAKITSYGRRDFIAKMDYAHHINFMSSSIWRVAAFQGSLSQGYKFAYAMSFVFVLLLTALGEANGAVLMNEAIIAKTTLSPISKRWAYRNFLLGWPVVLEVRMTAGERKLLARKMLKLFSPENVAAYLLADQVANSWEDRFLLFDLISSRVGAYRVHSFGRIRWWIWRKLFYLPRFSWRAVRIVIGLFNKSGLKTIDIRDIEGRTT